MGHKNGYVTCADVIPKGVDNDWLIKNTTRVSGKNTLISGRAYIFHHSVATCPLFIQPAPLQLPENLILHQISCPEMGSQNTSSSPSLQFSGGLSSNEDGLRNLTLSFSSVGLPLLGKPSFAIIALKMSELASRCLSNGTDRV